MFDLLYACAVGDEATAAHCLRRAASGCLREVARTCGRGRSPLHVAILGGNGHLVPLLLRAGAACDAQDRDGVTAAMFAAQRELPDALAALISAGANLQLRARDGSVALHCAARSGNTAAITQLLQAGCPLHTVDLLGNTPLHEACGNGHVEAAHLLLQAGASANSGACAMRRVSSPSDA